MTGNEPVQVVAAAFQDEVSASIAIADLKSRQVDRLGIRVAAVLRKSADGKLRIKETVGGRRGAAFGGAAGAAIGLIAGPALVVPAAVGALIGGLASRARGSGLSPDRLERLGASMPPGSSVLVAIVDQNWVTRLEEQLVREGATLLVEPLTGNIAEQLEADHDAIYAELAATHDLASSREASPKTERDVMTLAADADEVVGSKWVATDEGFVARDTDAEDDSDNS